MFDHIVCNYPLPISKEVLDIEGFDISDVDFQTKNLENLLDVYTITEDGELFHTLNTYEWVDDDDAFLKGYMKVIDSKEVKELFYGRLNFYCYEQIKTKKEDGTIKETSVSLDYEAKFDEGNLVSLELVDQSIEDTTDYYIKTQKLLDEMFRRSKLWYNKYIFYTKPYRAFKNCLIIKPIRLLHQFTGWLVRLSYKI